jgi:hypothetical protein
LLVQGNQKIAIVHLNPESAGEFNEGAVAMNTLGSTQSFARIGAGAIIVVAATVVVLVLVLSDSAVGWVQAWHIFAVPSMQPPFHDMQFVTDHAGCFAKGFNAYFPNPCDPFQTPFNYPPLLLWIGYLGINGGHTIWLAVLMAIMALAALVALMRGQSISAGALISLAIISPSVLLGFERGNIDLFILALVGGAALLIARHGAMQTMLATVLLCFAVGSKLYPVFCVALLAKFSRRNLKIMAILGIASAVYFVMIYDIIPIIRANTPSSSWLSYGYKVTLLTVDDLLRGAGLPPTGRSAGWMALTLALCTFALAVTAALRAFRQGSCDCEVADDAAGTAFLFGAGIYCGSFMLGANYIYRLTFLLLCIPQVLDWLASFQPGNRTKMIARLLLFGILGVLWLHGGVLWLHPIFIGGVLWLHPIFMAIPLAFDWALLFGLAAVLALNFLRSLRELLDVSSSAHRRRHTAC